MAGKLLSTTIKGEEGEKVTGEKKKKKMGRLLIPVFHAR